MAYLKQGTNFLYDNTTGDIVGIKDADGGEKYFASLTQFQPASYKFAPGLSIAAAAATFTSLTYENDGGNVRVVSAGVHGIAAGSVGHYVYVTWAGGTGVNGFYKILDRAVTTKLTIELAHVSGLGTPTVSLVNADITLATQTIPAGTMNVGMSLELDMLFSCTGSSNNKTVKANLGSAAWYSQTFASSFQSLCVEKKACVISSTDIISNALAAPGHGTATGANVTMTPSGGVGAAQDFTIVGSIANAGEFLTLNAWSLKINGA
jgi:hypothetical protein